MVALEADWLSTDLSTVTRDVAAEDLSAPCYLRVAVNAPLRNGFDYLPPDGRPARDVPLGSRVRVPIGRRTAIGIVIGHATQSAVDPAAIKPVHEVLDGRPLLDAQLLRLLHWTADYYHHPLGEVLAAALPKSLKEGAPATAQIAIWQITPAGAAALESGACGRAQAQAALLTLLATHPQGMSGAQIARLLSGWRAPARALLPRGWVATAVVEASEAAVPGREVPGHPAGPAQSDVSSAPALSPPQAEAVAAVAASAGRYECLVLRGATGSGKTEVYLRAAAAVIERGGSVLMLVPEIALTPQLVERVSRRLPADIAVLHSGVGDAERLAAWRRARAGRARIVLGTRSAVFAPLTDLQLIIVDEEHDGSYKQYDGGCRYSGRDVAVIRAHQLDIPVLLGSATPSFETLHNARAGRYRELLLPRREDQAPAPQLVLVDLRSHTPRQGLAAPVTQAIRRHLGAGGQVIVFINRRGYAPTLLCTACGWVAPCPDCDARLTVHQGESQLSCHHCGHRRPLPDACPRCGFRVKPVGQGTERVEQTLRELFPAETLTRLDRDTATGAADLERIVDSVQTGAARILVGTQMVTKGHHFPGVTLVVVLNADQGLFSVDFRSAERLAQTIVQVAGRAGREQQRGEVLIQTEYPDHPLLQSLLSGGYEAFATTAMAEREAAGWPPYSRLAVLRASSAASDGAMRFLAAVRQQAPADPAGHGRVRVLGPAPALLARRAGRYYAQLLIESAERAALHRFIDDWQPQIEKLARLHRVRYALDVDPLDVQ
jgi:primosomal protein N' (replication factor Y)